jgi:hypothetical protein
MSIPYRDEQILRILAANPDGLTTGQILAIAKTQRANELPDSNIVSQRIWSLRNTKTPKIESKDTAAGRTHKITAAGRKIVDELGPNKLLDLPAKPAEAEQSPTFAESAITATPHAPDVEQSLDSDEKQDDSGDLIDVLQQFDQAVAIIREALIATLNTQAEPIKITDKRAKIDLLEKLENMPLLEPWAAALIGEIRVDLDQFEGG